MGGVKFPAEVVVFRGRDWPQMVHHVEIDGHEVAVRSVTTRREARGVPMVIIEIPGVVREIDWPVPEADA